MGIFSGSVAIRRYRVMQEHAEAWREQFEKAIRAHALVPLDPESGRNETKSIGWASVYDEQDLDLSMAKWWMDGRILLSLRVDTLKPDTAEVKRLLKLRQRELEAERKEPLSASALRELKDMIVLDLRRRTPPKTKTVDMVWDLDKRRVYLCSHSKAMNEAFLRLFAETFNLPLDIEGPSFWASQEAEASGLLDALHRCRPAVELLGGFAGLRPCPRLAASADVWSGPAADDQPETDPIKAHLEDQRYLAREFLTWLIYKSDEEAGSGKFAEVEGCDAFRVHVGERVILKALGEGGSEITQRGVAPAETADLRYSIAGGLTVRESELLFERGDRLWSASVMSEGFDMRRVKMPSLLSEEDTERALERLALLDDLDVMVRSAFGVFVRMRLSPLWQAEELPRLREWLERSITTEKEAA